MHSYNNIGKNLFSITNQNNHKIITILGLKIKIKPKNTFKQKLHNLEKKLIEQQKIIDDLQKNSLKTNQIADITEIAMLKTKYHWDDIKIPMLNNGYKTVEILKSSDKSIIRFGDGEFKIMGGGDIVFQNYHPYIAEKLKEIIKSGDENLLIGIPEPYYDCSIDLFEGCQRFILKWFPEWHKIIEKYYNYNRTYSSTHISQSFPIYAKYDFETLYSDFKEIWHNKKITIITGDRVYNKIQYNIFENAAEISYIYGPTENAFDKYEELKSEISKVSQDNILIFALGPAGKVLAYDMYKLGYRVLDLGHIIKDYDFYRKSVSMSKDEWNKYRKTFFYKD